MEDISKGTVTLLLIITVFLSVAFTWIALNSNQQAVVVQQEQPEQPHEGGQVAVRLLAEGETANIIHISDSAGSAQVTVFKGG